MRLFAMVALLSFVFSLLLVANAEARCSDQGTCKTFGRHGQLKKPSDKRRASRLHQASSNNHVAAMIRRMALIWVSVWFALRIAKVESGFKPHVRGGAGEYGVFQLKCRTARGLGYRGACSGLLNASTNIKYGLKHLSLAVKSSCGNLKLAGSKHNGGLGRKRLVLPYVALVF